MKKKLKWPILKFWQCCFTENILPILNVLKKFVCFYGFLTFYLIIFILAWWFTIETLIFSTSFWIQFTYITICHVLVQFSHFFLYSNYCESLTDRLYQTSFSFIWWCGNYKHKGKYWHSNLIAILHYSTAHREKIHLLNFIQKNT